MVAMESLMFLLISAIFCFFSSSVKGVSSCRIRICFTSVDLPDSPAPSSSSRCVALYVRLSFSICKEEEEGAALIQVKLEWSDIVMIPALAMAQLQSRIFSFLVIPDPESDQVKRQITTHMIRYDSGSGTRVRFLAFLRFRIRIWIQ